MAKNKGGRPTLYTPELDLEICTRLMAGESLLRICQDEKMPERTVVHRWLADGKHAQFNNNYAHAREVQAENMFDEILDISDDGSNDFYQKELDGGKIIEVPDHEHMARSRLRVDTRKFYLSKVLPKKFGDRVQQDVIITNNGIGEALVKLTEKYMNESTNEQEKSKK